MALIWLELMLARTRPAIAAASAVQQTVVRRNPQANRNISPAATNQAQIDERPIAPK